MTTTAFQRARSPEAREQRERAILEAARVLGATRGIRPVTLTDIAASVGMHKSAMLRYFETREQIFLTLTAEGWREWSRSVRAELHELSDPDAAAIAAVIATSLVERPLFCDLLAHAPLNLERNVSIDAVRAFKKVTLGEVAEIGAVLMQKLDLSETQAADTLATATSMAGALCQMAAPGTDLRALYESEPELAHAVVDVGPQLIRILTAMLVGFS